MDIRHDLIQCLLTFMWSFMISLFAMPSIIAMAHQKKLLDKPNERTMHTVLTPRLGGVGIFAGFFSALTIFGNFKTDDLGVQMLLAGAVILFFIGLKDDIIPVSVFKKFFMQVLAASIVVFFGDVRIESFYGFLDIQVLDSGVSYGITFLVLIGVTNAVNLIDGLDGLAGSVILFVCLFFGTAFFLGGSPYVFVAIALGGALLGFLRYNFYRARIFMGDTGSLLSGFVIAILAIKSVDLQIDGVNMPAMTLAVLIIPVIDTLRVFSLRVLDGKSPFTPDKRHLHHELSTFGFNSPLVVGILLLMNLFFILTVYQLGKFCTITELVFSIIALALFFLGALIYVPRIFRQIKDEI
jgi:UDP-GlcNAc:undecaprenyl-phosphate GlcNAc-1-phosphate transferase